MRLKSDSRIGGLFNALSASQYQHYDAVSERVSNAASYRLVGSRDTPQKGDCRRSSVEPGCQGSKARWRANNRGLQGGKTIHTTLASHFACIVIICLPRQTNPPSFRLLPTISLHRRERKHPDLNSDLLPLGSYEVVHCDTNPFP